MILLLLACLYCAAPTSTKSLLHFYGPSEYGVIHDDRPAVQHRVDVKTTMKSSIDEVVALNLPQAIDKDAIAKPKDCSTEERKLPILRAEAEAEGLKPAVQPQPNYVLMGSTDQQVEPERQILHAAEVLDVGQTDKRRQPQGGVVLRNSLTHAEVIPTDVAPAIVTTTTTTRLPTSVTMSHEPIASKAHATEVPFVEKVEDKGGDFDVADELPAAKTYDVKEILPNMAKDELPAINKEESAAEVGAKAKPTISPLDQKFKEDEEDSDVLPEFDEKGDVELEFHDEPDTSTTSATEIVTSPTTPKVTTSPITVTTSPATVPTSPKTTSLLMTTTTNTEVQDVIISSDKYDKGTVVLEIMSRLR
ncbi:unnamed protein product [Strongylus vulgaris]|uniref:Uncharacterized protein n=1 Tax=Strongylus vulgaris TaxID=40348 RepID=A0A3P7LX33_STRVU|nr:unnamed protein product [Strongylus vulgaris]